MDLKQMLGQKIVLGFHGLEMPEEFVNLIREYKIGNVIIFQRNVESAQQLRRLCGQIRQVIQEATGYLPFIIIDQEGGMVSRIPADAVNVPSAMALGAAGDPENTHLAAQITARQLRGLGPNFTMAPVLDVNTNANNPVIGIRSYGDDPEKVADHGVAAVRGYEGSGILCCGKHFPGHGDTAVDSHLGLPCVDKSLAELENAELIPFRRAVEAGIPAIMSSHILFPQIEPEKIPGTMSRRIITGLLKERLGFKGLVLTDCLEMNAIQKFYGTSEGMLAAFQAGVDLAEISSTFSLEADAVRYVNEAAERGELDLEEVRASVEKILAYKEKLAEYPLEPELCNRDEDRAAAAALAAKAVTCCSGTPIAVNEKTLFCGCADYRTTEAANKIACVDPFPAYMSRCFGAQGLVTPKDPGEADIANAVEEAKKWDSIVLSTCNGHLFPGQLALAEALQKLGKPMMIVLLRNPYDLPRLPECDCRLALFDYTEDSFRALTQVLRGAEAPGRMPVRL